MPRHFSTEIENLKKKILTLGTVVEESLHKAMRAVDERDARLARKIVDDDEEVDRMEVELEEDCLKVLALYQPVAIDLRYIVAILKINSDLERIGDLAVNLAQRAEYLSTRERVEISFDYREMARKVERMLKDSLDALVNLDAKLAREVWATDDEVDSLYRQMFALVQEYIRADPDQMDQYLQYLSVARYLERAADHATNIAEDVIYMVAGEIVRHRLKSD
jgi:phosphate transport system protein